MKTSQFIVLLISIIAIFSTLYATERFGKKEMDRKTKRILRITFIAGAALLLIIIINTFG